MSKYIKVNKNPKPGRMGAAIAEKDRHETLKRKLAEAIKINNSSLMDELMKAEKTIKVVIKKGKK